MLFSAIIDPSSFDTYDVRVAERLYRLVKLLNEQGIILDDTNYSLIKECFKTFRDTFVAHTEETESSALKQNYVNRISGFLQFCRTNPDRHVRTMARHADITEEQISDTLEAILQQMQTDVVVLPENNTNIDLSKLNQCKTISIGSESTDVDNLADKMNQYQSERFGELSPDEQDERLARCLKYETTLTIFDPHIGKEPANYTFARQLAQYRKGINRLVETWIKHAYKYDRTQLKLKIYTTCASHGSQNANQLIKTHIFNHLPSSVKPELFMKKKPRGSKAFQERFFTTGQTPHERIFKVEHGIDHLSINGPDTAKLILPPDGLYRADIEEIKSLPKADWR